MTEFLSDATSQKQMQSRQDGVRADDLKQKLSENGLKLVGQASINVNRQLTATVRTSKGELLDLMVDMTVPADETIQLNFKFKDGLHGGQKFTLGADQLAATFYDENGLSVSAASVFEKLEKKYEKIASDITPEPQPVEAEPKQSAGKTPIHAAVTATAPITPFVMPDGAVRQLQTFAVSAPDIAGFKPVAVPPADMTRWPELLPQIPSVQAQKATLAQMKKVIKTISVKMPAIPVKKQPQTAIASAAEAQSAPGAQSFQGQGFGGAELLAPQGGLTTAKKQFPWGKIGIAAAVTSGPLIGFSAYGLAASTNFNLFNLLK